MARLLANGRWYDPVPVAAMYESEYERILVQNADNLYPEYYLVPFKIDIISDYDRVRPDCALIEKGYREWWVVEVEMAHHPFESHVRPQIQAIASGSYGEREANYLATQAPALDRSRLLSLMKGLPPRILVLVNQPCPSWTEPLRMFNAIVAHIEIYRSRHNDYICRVNGEHPKPQSKVLTHCRVYPAFRGFLEIQSPGSLSVLHGEHLESRYRGEVLTWERIDIQNKVFLRFVGRDHKLQPGVEYVILSVTDQPVEIRRIVERRGRR